MGEVLKSSLREGRGEATKRGPVFMGGVVPCIHYEGDSHYVILLF